jgi:hypothetical protein
MLQPQGIARSEEQNTYRSKHSQLAERSVPEPRRIRLLFSRAVGKDPSIMEVVLREANK